ncbi:MAG: lysophospholipid acyltransferase family protein, partial [Phycisphaerae bacterium]
CWIRLFSLSGLYRLGQFFGTLEYLVDYKRRRRVRQKLRSFFKDEFPNAWHRRVTRRYFMRIRCDKMFYTIMDRIPRGKLMNRIKLIGLSHIDDALSKGNGVYVALCHFGSHHVAGLMMALLGYELAGIRDSKESPVRRYIQQKYRETFPEVSSMKLFPATSFPRGIYRHLQSNKIVASLLDADRKRGEHTKTKPAVLFGEPRDLLIGPLQIAIRCRSTTLQGFVVSRRNFYFQVILTPPLIEPEVVVDETEAIASAIRRYAEVVEMFARENPDHLMNI